MTGEAQMALRRIIETQANRARFVLLANDYTNIIEAIQSRAVILKFNQIEPGAMRSVLERIIVSESITMRISDELLELILINAYGDLKQALNYLQVILNTEAPQTEVFYEIFGLPQLPEIKRMIGAVRNKPTEAYGILQKLIDQGYWASDILDILLKVLVINVDQLPKDLQTKYLKAVSECFYLTEYTGTNHHLYALLAQMSVKARE
jgi:DNA polymerase III delta prime subunit